MSTPDLRARIKDILNRLLWDAEHSNRPTEYDVAIAVGALEKLGYGDSFSIAQRLRAALRGWNLAEAEIVYRTLHIEAAVAVLRDHGLEEEWHERINAMQEESKKPDTWDEAEAAARLGYIPRAGDDPR